MVMTGNILGAVMTLVGLLATAARRSTSRS